MEKSGGKTNKKHSHNCTLRKKAQTQKRIVLFQTQNLSHGLQLCAATTEQHCVEIFFEEKNCRQHQTTAMMMAQKHHHVILNELGGRDNLKNFT